MLKILMASAMAMLLTGCHTINSVSPDGAVGFQVHDRSYDQVWNAAVNTVASQLTIVESSREAGKISARSRVGLATWGEVVGVFISPQTAQADVYTVKVQSLKRAALQITGRNWTNTIISGIKANLGL